MSTLSMKPEAAAARRAAKAASAMPAPSAAPPAPPSAGREATLSNKHDRKRQQLDALEAELARRWPHLFADRANPVPLAIGIRWAILPYIPEANRPLLPAVLGRWCSRGKYKHALTQPGAHRVGLDGSITPVSPEQAEHARVALGITGVEKTRQRASCAAGEAST